MLSIGASKEAMRSSNEKSPSWSNQIICHGSHSFVCLPLPESTGSRGYSKKRISELAAAAGSTAKQSTKHSAVSSTGATTNCSTKFRSTLCSAVRSELHGTADPTASITVLAATILEH